MNRDEELFQRIIGEPPESRATRLAEWCAGDEVLKARVYSLVKAHETAARFLESPVAGAPPAALIEESAGSRIGRYKLLQKIGEGGCGVVYMAEQEEPVHRRVALKIIKIGMDTRAVITRFEAERQALAMMDHPNIARVLDGSATETGRPYFVMELVRGVPITRFCDEGRLDTRRRLELFLLVCQAVQHAHQKGVIHRDLKPSNILVTMHDGVPVPKVIDFGIAKATNGRLTNRTLFTAFEQFMGTPAYMSPEQAEMSGLDVDTRSDIYSLGILLYELLAGGPPFDPKTFSSAGIDEIRRVIREVEPPRPSVRISTLDGAGKDTVARGHGLAAPQLSSQLRGELDWIVMRCLEKNRARRYDTANALAMDIQRYLRNEPVLARPPSTAYLVQKLVSRNRLVVATGVVVFCSLVAGFAGMAARWSLSEKLRQREEQQATETKDLLHSTLWSISVADALTDNPAVVRTMFDRAVTEVAGHDPSTHQAELFEILGRSAFNVGLLEQAQSAFGRALSLRRQLQGSNDPDVARSLIDMALVLSALDTRQMSQQMQSTVSVSAVPRRQGSGFLAEAESDLREAIRVLGDGAKSTRDIARARSNLGWVLGQAGDRSAAENELKRAISLQQAAGDKLELARSLKWLGFVYIHDNRLAEASANITQARELDQEALGGPDHLEVASDLNFLATALAIEDGNQGTQIADAIGAYYHAIDIRDKLKQSTGAASQPSNPPLTNFTRQGTVDEVMALVGEARRYAYEHRVANDPWTDTYYLAMTAFVLLAEKNYVKAESFARECYDNRRALDPNDWGTYDAAGMLGMAMAGQGKAEGLTYLTAAYTGLKNLQPSLRPERQIWFGVSMCRLVLVLNQVGRAAEAAGVFRDLQQWAENPEVPANSRTVVADRLPEDLRNRLKRTGTGLQ